MEEKLKLNKQDIEELVLKFDQFKSSYLRHKYLCENTVTALWVSYFFLFAVIGMLIPKIENVLLIGLSGGVIPLIKLIPILSRKIISLYLTKINKNMGREVQIYEKYHKIIKINILETLNEGSDSNFLQKVIIKTLAKTY